VKAIKIEDFKLKIENSLQKVFDLQSGII